MSAIEFVKREVLDQKIRVVISDGRVIEGELVCLDKDKNMILNEAAEYYINAEDPIEGIFHLFWKVFYLQFCVDGLIHRNLGSTMIPGAHIKKVFKIKPAADEEPKYT